MEENRLQKYLDGVAGHHLLSAEQEQQLSARALQGDRRAIDRLAEANLRLVAHVAHEYQGRGLAFDDLVSEGSVGLVKAAQKYDAKRGGRFAGYAIGCIRREMLRALQREVRRREEPERRPGGQTRSLDAPLGAKPNISLLQVLADGNTPQADGRTLGRAQEEQAEQALRVLNRREGQVVAAYFGIGQDRRTMAEIAEEMGLKRERVRQIRDVAVRRMRKAVRRRRDE